MSDQLPDLCVVRLSDLHCSTHDRPFRDCREILVLDTMQESEDEQEFTIAAREPICPGCGGFSWAMAEDPAQWVCEECGLVWTP